MPTCMSTYTGTCGTQTYIQRAHGINDMHHSRSGGGSVVSTTSHTEDVVLVQVMVVLVTVVFVEVLVTVDTVDVVTVVVDTDVTVVDVYVCVVFVVDDDGVGANVGTASTCLTVSVVRSQVTCLFQRVLVNGYYEPPHSVSGGFSRAAFASSTRLQSSLIANGCFVQSVHPQNTHLKTHKWARDYA